MYFISSKSNLSQTAEVSLIVLLSTSFTEVKEKFDRAMQLSSNEERVIHEFCDQMQIPFDKIALGIYADTEPVQAAEKSQQHEGESPTTITPSNKKQKEKITSFLQQNRLP